jgi:hypothetical protein
VLVFPVTPLRPAIVADKRAKQARTSYSEKNLWLRSLLRLLRQLVSEEPPI